MSFVRSYESTIECLTDLYSRPLIHASAVGLRRVNTMLDYLGHPEQHFRSVHVTGSSGKGSTTTMIGSVLQHSGYRTGYFRSPHLQTYRERIAVQGNDISEECWCRCFSAVWPIVECMRDGTLDGYQLGRPTFFEVIFAMMCVHFAESGVEWSVVEAGLGGRLDATNVLRPDVAVVTNVSLEHTQVLGNDVATIASEKAAIFKAGTHAVTAAQDVRALAVLKRCACEIKAPLLHVGSDVQIEFVSSDLRGQVLLLTSENQRVEATLQLAGDAQAWNAGTAYAAVLALRQRGVDIGNEALVSGLSAARLPGRFEIVSQQPLVILDGAHHPAAIEQLVETMRRLIPERESVFLFGALSDKDVGAMAGHIGKVARSVILTRVPDSPRTATLAQLREAFLPHVATIIPVDDVESALGVAQNILVGAALVITGSLYLVGYARAALVGKAAVC